MKASDPEVKAALAMQTLWRALCAARAHPRAAARRIGPDGVAAPADRERRARASGGGGGALRAERVQGGGAPQAPQSRPQARRRARRTKTEAGGRATASLPRCAGEAKARSGDQLRPSRRGEGHRREEARAKRDRLVAAEPVRVKGRGVGAVVGAVLGERRARIAGGVLQIDGLRQRRSSGWRPKQRTLLHRGPRRAPTKTCSIDGGRSRRRAHGMPTPMEAWIDVRVRRFLGADGAEVGDEAWRPPRRQRATRQPLGWLCRKRMKNWCDRQQSLSPNAYDAGRNRTTSTARGLSTGDGARAPGWRLRRRPPRCRRQRARWR